MLRAILFLLIAGVLCAHHSITAAYDDTRTVTLSGVVTKFDWANPHVWVFVDVNGTPQGVEFASRLELKRSGWSADSIKVGDQVTVTGNPAREGGHNVHGKTLVITDHGLFRTFNEASPEIVVTTNSGGKPSPRWPDGHPRLGPEPGKSGYWASPSVPSLYEASAGKIRMNSEGILTNSGDANKVAPFQPWAKALYLYRQHNFLKDDPMSSCLPPGGPRQFQAPYGVQFLEEQARQRILVLSRGGNRNWRLINLDGRPLPALDDLTPTYFGYSVAKWEGDTLVIQSVGYVERFWMSAGGLPHTESARLTERISRPNFDTLKYEVTVDDPGAYTRPWTGGWTLQWIAADESDEYFCDDYNRELERGATQ